MADALRAIRQSGHGWMMRAACSASISRAPAIPSARSAMSRACAGMRQSANSLAGPLLFWLPRTGPGEEHALSVAIQPLVLRASTSPPTRTGTLYPNISLLTTCPPARQLDTLAQQAAGTVLQVKHADVDRRQYADHQCGPNRAGQLVVLQHAAALVDRQCRRYRNCMPARRCPATSRQRCPGRRRRCWRG